MLKIAVLYYNFFYGAETESRKEIKQRLRDKAMPACNANIALELKPPDVTALIHCNERTAKEYIDLLRIIMM